MIVITIPAYNEARTISLLLEEIRYVMDQTKYNYKILIVNDGSRDNTARIAKEHGAIVFSHTVRRGLAETFKTEIKKCLELKADIIVHIDADRQYLPREIPRLIEEVKKGNDLVLGSRFKGVIEKMPFIKKIGNRAFSWVVSNITRQRISDAQTGFRAFTKEVAENINIISNYTYTQEQIIKASKQNFRIKEIPVYFAKRKGKSKLMRNPFQYAAKTWITLFRIYRDYEPLKFFLRIGFSFFSIGIIIGLYLLYLFATTGMVKHIPLAILSMLLIMVGIQIILFGFLADMNKS